MKAILFLFNSLKQWEHSNQQRPSKVISHLKKNLQYFLFLHTIVEKLRVLNYLNLLLNLPLVHLRDVKVFLVI